MIFLEKYKLTNKEAWEYLLMEDLDQFWQGNTCSDMYRIDFEQVFRLQGNPKNSVLYKILHEGIAPNSGCNCENRGDQTNDDRFPLKFKYTIHLKNEDNFNRSYQKNEG